MKKLLLVLLVQSICHANIYDGNTDAIASPRDLSLNPMDIGQQDVSQTTSVKNYILTNLSGQDRLRTFTTTSQMVLENSTLELDGTFTFSHGSIKVVGNCVINGSSDFNKFRFESHLIHITEGSELRIGPGVNFEYASTCSLATGIRFANSASRLVLEDATLTVSNRHGLNLIRGILKIEGSSTIDNYFTEDTVAFLDTKTSFTETALVLGNGPSSDGDCKLQIASGAKLTIKNAGIIYRNDKAGSFDGSDGQGTLVIDKNGSFLIDSTGDFNSGGISFNMNNLSSKKRLGILVDLTSIDTIDFAGSNGTIAYSCVWTSDGKYLAVIGNTADSNNEVELFSFNGSNLTSIDTIDFSGANGTDTLTCEWSPDGKYLAVIGDTTDGDNEVEIFSFNGSSLTSIDTINFAGVNGISAYACDWSPDGKYLAVIGDTTDNNNDIEIFRFNGSGLTSIDTIDFAGSNGTYTRSCAWTLDGKYLVVVGDTADDDNEIEIFSFNGSSLTSIDSIGFAGANGTTDYSCAWSPNSKYLVVVGETTDNNNEIELFSFNGSSLTLIDTIDFAGSNGTTAYSCTWSPDGKYLVVVGNTADNDNEIEIFSFNGSSLTSINTINFVGANGIYPFDCAWSLDGKYLAVVGNTSDNDNEIEIFTCNYSVDDSKVAIVKDSTIKLDKDLTLRDINLKMK